MEYLKSDAKSESLEFLNIIGRNSKKISSLINELLDSNQYYKLKLEIIPLQVVISKALEEVADRIELKKVKVNFSKPRYEANALIDLDRMIMAIVNILVNAVEAMTTEVGQLTISILTHSSFHTIRIEDNGKGISPENITKLFEPYFTTKTTGLGLGLATTHSILQSHKAEIDVSSTVNKGTTFTIKIPAL
jgi:signal transduction histidine kinase